MVRMGSRCSASFFFFFPSRYLHFVDDELCSVGHYRIPRISLRWSGPVSSFELSPYWMSEWRLKTREGEHNGLAISVLFQQMPIFKVYMSTFEHGILHVLLIELLIF